MKLTIIDYGSGNLRSVYNAFLQVMPSEGQIRVSDHPDDLEWATHVVLPGVGAFGDCMRGLTARPGLHEALERLVHQHAYMPLLGICVGMQMLFERGLENGEHRGLGWLKGEVVGLRDWALGIREDTNPQCLMPNAQSLKIPHMGWNTLSFTRDHPLFKGLDEGEHVYFVHSYHAKAAAGDVIATTDYGGPVTAAVAKDHICGVQFHPEKSQQAGLAILANFLKM